MVLEEYFEEGYGTVIIVRLFYFFLFILNGWVLSKQTLYRCHCILKLILVTWVSLFMSVEYFGLYNDKDS